jgi:RNA polymerase sigma factor (sigma-70 family)
MEEVSPLPVAGPSRVRPLRQSEARLVRRATAGDEAAFETIFRRYSQDLYRFCRAILGDPTDAQDALQNTMTRVLQALPGEQRTINLRPWLYRVARNESLTLIREREQNAELTEESSPAAPAADISAEHRESVRTLVADLASLPETQRSALVLHEMSGLSHEEVSDALQRSPRASRQAIYEARLALQELKEGRAMDCDEIRSLISDGDGRVVRGRKIKAHLRDCQRCSDFALGIRQRQTLLGWLAPPMPAAAASGLIASALGGGTGAGGAIGAGAGAAGVLGGSAVLKSIGIVGAGLAIGVGGAGVAGVNLPLPGNSEDRSDKSAVTSEPEGRDAPAAAGPNVPSKRQAVDKASSAKGDGGARGSNATDGNRSSGSQGKRGVEPPSQTADKATGPPAQSNAGGNTEGLPAHSNAGGASAGPPANSNAGGNSAATPAPPRAGGTSSSPAHSNAGGVSSGPAEYSSSGGNSDKLEE